MTDDLTARATQIVRCGEWAWQSQITRMGASELYRLTDEIEAMLRHPSTSLWHAWRAKAAERLASLKVERDKRFHGIWWDDGMADIRRTLDSIFDACG